MSGDGGKEFGDLGLRKGEENRREKIRKKRCRNWEVLRLWA